MSNPDDDTDVPSGLKDDARMERTSPPPSHTRKDSFTSSRPPTTELYKSKFNGMRGGEPRGVWLRTLPVGSGYQHKHTH